MDIFMDVIIVLRVEFDTLLVPDTVFSYNLNPRTDNMPSQKSPGKLVSRKPRLSAPY